MDSIDRCRIDCKFVKSEAKRAFLEERLKDLSQYKEEICKALNDVCNSKVNFSCLQCFDKVSNKYSSGECKKSCDEKFRFSFCFKLTQDLIFNVIAEKDGNTIIVTFYPFSFQKATTLEEKCDNVINSI
ncbi:hypothetical protein [Acidianus brierleyi]|jgi:hypothetical protein|uniref:Uncharacterized protein n=1 Tax=Acidianus brierleyi TaxID=41673 RepID=A0A2U9IH52_9CREN|nr:hypothetical protein [Acidianus brierleyi]AWR95382.1 hypothetical protein DFR85_13020 [Acidianus brierleyi]PVU76472.1 hypothetical protein DDW12_10175 [Sulfolobus islandicus]